MLLISIFEMLGTVAFAISGALVGIEKKLDLFGVIFLSITTAVGGGIFRDLIIGNIPPVAFINLSYCLVSAGAGVITFMFYNKIIKFKYILAVSDAVGLGVFTALGSTSALIHGMTNPFIVTTMGLITGIGGGILRDVFAQDIPFVFRKEIYAVASMFGGIAIYCFHGLVPQIVSLYICFTITFVIRILSVIMKLNLPVVKIETKEA